MRKKKLKVRYLPTTVLQRTVIDPGKSPGEQTELTMLRVQISRALKLVGIRYSEVLRLRYGLDDGYAYTLEDVSRIFTVSRERVRAVEMKAVRRLAQKQFGLQPYASFRIDE